MPLDEDDARDFPVVEREYLHRLGRSNFDWMNFEDPSPRHIPTRPLAEARVGLLSTAGAHLPAEDPIRPAGRPRVLPVGAEIVLDHVGYDTKRAMTDPEVVWPVGTLSRLADQGVIGSLSEQAVSTMGAVLDGRVVLERHVPAAVDQFTRDEVDLALLVPA